ncbi:MAG: hypothetical protein AAF085_08395 [Planctomycetota bacterium]
MFVEQPTHVVEPVARRVLIDQRDTNVLVVGLSAPLLLQELGRVIARCRMVHGIALRFKLLLKRSGRDRVAVDDQDAGALAHGIGPVVLRRIAVQ